MNKMTKSGLDLIKFYEGLVLKAYKDSGGVWTIGYGHTAARGSPIPKAGMKITKAQADQIFLNDIKYFEAWVDKLVKVPLTDGQYSALVSFCFNLGPGNLQKSTLLRKLNARDYNGAANEFDKWVYDNGVRLRGLVKRRASEKVLFRSQKPVQSDSIAMGTPVAKSSGGFLGWLLGVLKTIFSGGQK